MCIKSRLQQHIRNLTNDGETVARFLVETVQGKHTDAKYHHKLEAAKLLSRYGSSEEDGPHFWGLMHTPEELAAIPSRHSRENGNPVGRGGETENSKLTTENSPVTHLDILNYEIAHLIRQETAEGHTIAEFLSHVMTRQDKPFTPRKLRIRHVDRFAAAMEILRRGHGHFSRKRKLVVDDYDTLHTDLAKRMREYTEHGTDAVRFLLDVMEDAGPDEPYTWRHRVSAAQELLRRGWDTNYDAITPEMLQDYWRDQQSSRLSVGQKKHLAGLPTFVDEYDQYDNENYQSIADAIREQEDHKESAIHETIAPSPNNPSSHNGIAPDSRHSRAAGNPGPLSPRERVREGASSPSCTSMSVPTDFDDDKPDCYYKPLNPNQQAIFDYQCKIESGEYEEGEITIRQPTPEDWKAFEGALAHITKIAAAEGVPLLPNPLAGALKMPTIRSP